MSEFKLKQTAEEVQKAIDDASIPSDWNQTDSSAADFIKNKPFGESPTGGDTLYWDGNTEGLVPVDLTGILGQVYYKVSSSTPTTDDLANATLNYTIPGSMLVAAVMGDFILGADGVFFVAGIDNLTVPLDETGTVTFTVAEKGVYIPSTSTIFNLHIPGYTGFAYTKKVEDKYIPSIQLSCNDETPKRIKWFGGTVLTNAELKEISKSSAKVCVGNSMVLYIDAGDTFGFIYFIDITGNVQTAYTAEYTI